MSASATQGGHNKRHYRAVKYIICAEFLGGRTSLPSLITNSGGSISPSPVIYAYAVRLCAALKATEKNKLLEVEGARAPVHQSERRQWSYEEAKFDKCSAVAEMGDRLATIDTG